MVIDAVANGVDVQLDGRSAGAADGLRLVAGADGSQLRGLRIFGFAQDGVEVVGAADCMMAARMAAPESVGSIDAHNAAAPVTCGVAIDVPLNEA